MTSLQSLCNVSGLISKLNENNYFSRCNNDNNILIDYATLSTILQSFDIYESVDDVMRLLTKEADRDIIDPLISRIGIERALTICDELSAQNIITNILLQKNHLDKIMNNCIINTYNISSTTCTYLWNIGYNIMTQNGACYLWALQTSVINNASRNGLFMRSIDHYYIDNDEECISRNVTNNIIHVQMRRHGDGEVLQLYNNVEHIDNMVDYDMGKLSCAKNIKSLSSLYITDDNLKACVNLQKLDMSMNYNITTCNQFANTLRTLIAETTGIDNNGLNMCKNIRILNAHNNHNITTCDPFASKLVLLYATKNSGISDQGILCCIRLKTLYANDNKKITTCAPFAKTLRVVGARGTCGITDAGLIGCDKLRELFVVSNPNIRSVKGFPLLKKFTCGNITTAMNDELKMLKYIRVFS